MIGLGTRLTARTLGRLEVRLDGQALPPPPGRGARLLALLLSAPAHSLARDEVAETLWPDSPNALINLHAAARDVRRWMRVPLGLVYERDLYALARVDVDADRFEAQIAAARAVRRIDPAEAARRYQSALRTYEGPFLAGEVGLDCVISRRAQLEEWFAEAAIHAGTRALAEGDLDTALELAACVLRLDDTREDAARLEMRALAGLGRRGEALRRFERLRLTLRQELGCLPDPATQAARDEVASAVCGHAPLLRLKAERCERASTYALTATEAIH
jgi:DNA-binding SARP family transcriptional activator